MYVRKKNATVFFFAGSSSSTDEVALEPTTEDSGSASTPVSAELVSDLPSTPKKSDNSTEEGAGNEDDDIKLFLEPDSVEEDWIPTSQKSPADTTVDGKTR